MSQYSVAEAKDRFSKLIREAESGSSVEITRRGKPVAYVVSIDQYARSAKPRMSLTERIADFRKNHAPDGIELDDDWLDDEHSKTPGRSFSW